MHRQGGIISALLGTMFIIVLIFIAVGAFALNRNSKPPVTTAAKSIQSKPEPAVKAAPIKSEPRTLEVVKAEVLGIEEQLQEARGKVSARHRATSEYIADAELLAEREKELKEARKHGNPILIVRKSGEWNKLRVAMEEREKAVIDADATVQQVTAKLNTAQAELETLEAERERLRQAAIELEKQLVALREQSRQPMDEISIGRVGVLPAFRVTQVIDDKTMLVETHGGKGMMLRGFSTRGMVDGQSYHLGTPAKVSGTEQYQTIIGGTRTVYLAVPYKLGMID